MSYLKQQDLQRLLKLDVEYPYFNTWFENFEFEVDSIPVKAICIHSWREDVVQIVSPFEVHGYQYNIGFRPLLIAIGISFRAREKALQAQGLTVRGHCLQMARLLYQKHFAYLQGRNI